jgi:hypothetical protein
MDNENKEKRILHPFFWFVERKVVMNVMPFDRKIAKDPDRPNIRSFNKLASRPDSLAKHQDGFPINNVGNDE